MSDDLERAKAFFLSDNGAGAAYEGGNTGRYYEALVALLAAAREDERRKVAAEALSAVEDALVRALVHGGPNGDVPARAREALARVRTLAATTHVPAYPGLSTHCAYCGQMCIRRREVPREDVVNRLDDIEMRAAEDYARDVRQEGRQSDLAYLLAVARAAERIFELWDAGCDDLDVEMTKLRAALEAK